jgi:hypothetical protein
MTLTYRTLLSWFLPELRRYGVKSVLNAAARNVQRRAYLRETHFGYEPPLETERPRGVSPPAGLTLVQAHASGITVLQELPTVNEWLARQRIKIGANLWLVLSRLRPVFDRWSVYSSARAMVAGSRPLQRRGKDIFRWY